MKSFRRFVVLALPCWVVAGPLTATVQGLALCPHQTAMPGTMHHGDAPCWCPDMAGAGALELPTIPAVTPEPTMPVGASPVLTSWPLPRSLPLPPSPSFAPTPPPPNRLT